MGLGNERGGSVLCAAPFFRACIFFFTSRSKSCFFFCIFLSSSSLVSLEELWSRFDRTLSLLAALSPSLLFSLSVDMDGTLTVPTLDFAAMRRDLGIDASVDVLAHVESAPTPEERRRRAEVIERHEHEAAEQLQLAQGLHELVEYLDSRGVPRAVLTRNRPPAVEALHRALAPAAPFVPALTREFLPFKPDPAPLLHVAQIWGVAPGELVMVGDSPVDDVACGARAGAAATVLLRHGWTDGLIGDAKPTFIADDLFEVRDILAKLLDAQE